MLWADGLRVRFDNITQGYLRLHDKRTQKFPNKKTYVHAREAELGTTWGTDGTRCAPYAHADNIVAYGRIPD